MEFVCNDCRVQLTNITEPYLFIYALSTKQRMLREGAATLIVFLGSECVTIVVSV